MWDVGSLKVSGWDTAQPISRDSNVQWNVPHPLIITATWIWPTELELKWTPSSSHNLADIYPWQRDGVSGLLMLTDVKGAIIEQIFIPSFSLSDQTAVTQTCQERQETWADEIIKKILLLFKYLVSIHSSEFLCFKRLFWKRLPAAKYSLICVKVIVPIF